MSIILASKSKVRAMVMESLGIPFEVMPAEIDEKAIRDNDLSIRAQKIARAKAEKISNERMGVIIACDTFSESNGKVFEKPSTKSEAKKMLNRLSDSRAVNYTGVCYIDRKKGIDFSEVVKVEYSFRKLYPGEIKTFVENYPVTDWAAGFALIYPFTNSFISNVKGSYTGLAYGFPTEILIPLLKKSGYQPKPKI